MLTRISKVYGYPISRVVLNPTRMGGASRGTRARGYRPWRRTPIPRFEPWQSAVDPGFWAELARRKLDNAGLSEDPWLITALYAPRQNAVVSSPCQLDARAFGAPATSPSSPLARGMAAASGRLEMPGTLVNVNTSSGSAPDRGRHVERREEARGGYSIGTSRRRRGVTDALHRPDVRGPEEVELLLLVRVPGAQARRSRQGHLARPARGTRRARRRRRRDIARMRREASARRGRPGARVVDRR